MARLEQCILNLLHPCAVARARRDDLKGPTGSYIKIVKAFIVIDEDGLDAWIRICISRHHHLRPTSRPINARMTPSQLPIPPLLSPR